MLPAQVDVELAGDLQVIGCPSRAHRVEEADAAASRDRDQRVGLGMFAAELHRLQVHPRERADDLEVAEFLGADIHQQVLAGGVLTVQTLD